MDNKAITDLEAWFEGRVFDPAPMAFGAGIHLHDIPLLVRTHLTILRRQLGNAGYKPYYDRLVALKTQIEANP